MKGKIINIQDMIKEKKLQIQKKHKTIICNDFLNVRNMLENLDEMVFSREVEFINLTKEGINNLDKSVAIEKNGRR